MPRRFLALVLVFLPLRIAVAELSPAKVFAPLRTLVGVWEGKTAQGRAFKVSDQLVARDSVLVETWTHELHDKGVRVQAVLPGATATEFWDVAGLWHDHLPSGIVMKSEDMVDAALVGLDAGEVVTIPPLQDGADWDRYELLRRDLGQKFGNSQPGARYRQQSTF